MPRNSYHVDGSELDELIAKLPGRGPPRPALEQLLPAGLGGAKLDRKAFRGDA